MGKILQKANKLRKQLKDVEAEHDALMEECKKEYTEERHQQNIKLVNKMSKLRDKIQALKSIPEVGKFANHHMYSDINPYEIVRIISDKTIEIRPMDAERDPDWKPEFVVGGFAGHCTNNNAQEWIYTSNPEAETIRIRKKKDRDEWTHSGSRFVVSNDPIKGRIMNIETILADIKKSAQQYSEMASDINHGNLPEFVKTSIDYIDSVDNFGSLPNTMWFRVVSRNGRVDRETRKRTGVIRWCFTVKVVFQKFTAGGFHVELTTEL